MDLPEFWDGFVVALALVGGTVTAWRHRPTEAEWRAMVRNGRTRDCARRVGPPPSHVRRISDETPGWFAPLDPPPEVHAPQDLAAPPPPSEDVA